MRPEPNRYCIPGICRRWQLVPGFLLAALLSASAAPCGQQNVSGTQSAHAKPVPVASAGEQSGPDTREQQIADDSAQLLKLAIELKAEVDKTTKDTLSVAVIRKADAIEHIARGVKEKIRVNVPAN